MLEQDYPHDYYCSNKTPFDDVIKYDVGFRTFSPGDCTFASPETRSASIRLNDCMAVSQTSAFERVVIPAYLVRIPAGTLMYATRVTTLTHVGTTNSLQENGSGYHGKCWS